MMRFSTLVLAALAALIAAPALACSTNSASIIPADVVRAAADRAAEEKTVSFEMTVTIEGVPFFGEMETSASGSMDFEQGLGSMFMQSLGLSYAAVTTPDAIFIRMSFFW